MPQNGIRNSQLRRLKKHHDEQWRSNFSTVSQTSSFLLDTPRLHITVAVPPEAPDSSPRSAEARSNPTTQPKNSPGCANISQLSPLRHTCSMIFRALFT